MSFELMRQEALSGSGVKGEVNVRDSANRNRNPKALPLRRVLPRASLVFSLVDSLLRAAHRCAQAHRPKHTVTKYESYIFRSITMCAVSWSQRVGLLLALLCLLRPTTLVSALAINVSSAAPFVDAHTEYGPILGFTDGEGDDRVDVSH